MPAFLALLCLAPSLTLNAGAELVCPWLPGTSPTSGRGCEGGAGLGASVGEGGGAPDTQTARGGARPR